MQSGGPAAAHHAGKLGGALARLFCPVHGGIRSTQQAVLVSAVFGGKGQADAAAQGNQVLLDLEGVGKHPK